MSLPRCRSLRTFGWGLVSRAPIILIASMTFGRSVLWGDLFRLSRCSDRLLRRTSQVFIGRLSVERVVHDPAQCVKNGSERSKLRAAKRELSSFSRRGVVFERKRPADIS